MKTSFDTYAHHYASLSEDDLQRLTLDVKALLPEAREALRSEMERRQVPVEGIDWTPQPVVQDKPSDGEAFRRFVTNLLVFAACDIGYFIIAAVIVSNVRGVDIEKFAADLTEFFIYLSFALAVLTARPSFLPKRFVPQRIKAIVVTGIAAPPIAFLLSVIVEARHLGTIIGRIFWPVVIIWLGYDWWRGRRVRHAVPSAPAQVPDPKPEARKQPMKGHRWGKFQGWVILLFGVFGLLMRHSLLLLNLWGIVGAVVQIAAGYWIIRRSRVGIALFYSCCALLGIGILRGISLGAFSDGFAVASCAVMLCWWGIPAVVYYPKRWKEFSSGQGASKDDVQAATWFHNAAARGDAKAQTNLSLTYAKGQGEPQDLAQAVVWYRNAAERGDADAPFILGLMYKHGQGVPQDYAQAAAWFRKAAEQGNAEAQYNLGVSYDYGEGVPQDYDQAALWYHRAAEQGDALAQHSLGSLYHYGVYRYGQDAPQDYAQAAVWYRKAAEQGNLASPLMLGSLYENGQGVPHDNVEAYFWYSLAATTTKGSEKPCDEVAEKLTPIQLLRVQERVAKWLEAHPVEADTQ